MPSDDDGAVFSLSRYRKEKMLRGDDEIEERDSDDDAALLPPPRWRLRRQDLGWLLASSAFGVRKAASANFNPMKKKNMLGLEHSIQQSK